jgi:hypothetical protein
MLTWQRVSPDRPETSKPADSIDGHKSSPLAGLTPSSHASQAAASHAPPTETALPPVDTALASVIAELKRRSEGGDVHANCRLAFELHRCAGLEPLQRSINMQKPLDEDLLSLLHPIERERRIKAFEQRMRSLDSRLRHLERVCAGVPDKDIETAWRYHLFAAQAGHVPSMVRWVAAPPLEPIRGTPLSNLDGWIAYRDNARQWLDAAIEAGDIHAFEVAAHAHARDNWKGMTLVPKDGVRSVAYWMALERVAAPVYAGKVRDNRMFVEKQFALGSAELAESARLSTELAKHLANVPPGSVDLSTGTFGADDGSHCARP